MALGFNRRRINVKGGGTLQVREVDPTPGSWQTIGFIKDSTFVLEPQMVESIDDKGDQIDNKIGGKKASWRATLMQSSKDEYQLVKDAEEKIYEMYYHVLNADGNHFEVVFPLVRIKPGFESSFQAATERGIQVEFYALAPATALTRTPTAYNSLQWEPFVISENASEQGAPSDNASVPAGAI
jgi:hypothetical protein